MIMLTKQSSVVASPVGKKADQDLLNNFFGSVKQSVSNAPQQSFHQMFNSIYQNQISQ